MSKKYQIIISVIIISAFVYGVNTYILRSDNIAYGNSLVSSFGDENSYVETNIFSSGVDEEIAFLNTLNILNSIQIDRTLFTSDIFKSLKDNRVLLDPVDPGRNNPFAPIGSSSAN